MFCFFCITSQVFVSSVFSVISCVTRCYHLYLSISISFPHNFLTFSSRSLVSCITYQAIVPGFLSLTSSSFLPSLLVISACPFFSYLKHYSFLLHQQSTVATSHLTFSLSYLIAHSFNTTSCPPFMYILFFFLSHLHYPLFLPSLTLAKHSTFSLFSLFPSSLIYTISCLSFPATLFSFPISISH